MDVSYISGDLIGAIYISGNKTDRHTKPYHYNDNKK